MQGLRAGFFRKSLEFILPGASRASLVYVSRMLRALERET
jgi:hypothetical protein